MTPCEPTMKKLRVPRIVGASVAGDSWNRNWDDVISVATTKDRRYILDALSAHTGEPSKRKIESSMVESSMVEEKYLSWDELIPRLDDKIVSTLRDEMGFKQVTKT